MFCLSIINDPLLLIEMLSLLQDIPLHDDAIKWKHFPRY